MWALRNDCTWGKSPDRAGGIMSTVSGWRTKQKQFISRYWPLTYFLLSESIQTDCGANPASSSVATGNKSLVKRAAYEAELNEWHYTSIPPWRLQVQVQLLKHCGYYVYHVKGKKAKFSRYRPAVAPRVGRGIALLVHDDRGTRRGWVVSSTPRPHVTPGKDPVPILQEAGWVPGPVWTGGKFRPHRDSIPDRPARSSVAIPTELPGPHMYHVLE